MSNKYHRRTIRLRGFDYSQGGYYFVTICTYNREYIFGDIVNGEIKLNIIGIMVDDGWLKIPEHFPNCQLDTYQIMPNHIHGILIVGANNYSPAINLDKQANLIRANDDLPLHGTSKTIGSIIRGFKIGVTKWCRQNSEIYGVWQRNYYEHIIRNEQDYRAISQYIQDNPKNWEKDVLNIQ